MIKIYEFIKKNRALSIIAAVLLGLGSIAMLYSFIRNLLEVCDITTLFLAIFVGAFCVVIILAEISFLKSISKKK